jgi:hypothetical protein
MGGEGDERSSAPGPEPRGGTPIPRRRCGRWPCSRSDRRRRLRLSACRGASGHALGFRPDHPGDLAGRAGHRIGTDEDSEPVLARRQFPDRSGTLGSTPVCIALVVRIGHDRKCRHDIGTSHLERCESGRIGLTANELTWETGSEGSNPSLSAKFWSAAPSGQPDVVGVTGWRRGDDRQTVRLPSS